MCKHGGLYENIGKIAADGHHLHAINTEPRFFDISYVGRPADRIAYAFGILKAASGVVSGAELAEHIGITTPYYLHEPAIHMQVKAAELLLTAELAMLQDATPALNLGIPKFAAQIPAGDPLAVCSALRDQGVVLPFETWLRTVAMGQDVKEAAALAKPYLPRLFATLTKRADWIQHLRDNPFAGTLATGSPLEKWAAELATSQSFDESAVRQRVVRAVVRNESCSLIKAASSAVPTTVEPMLLGYGLYKVAALANLLSRNSENSRITTLLVRQNFLS
jgi:hypothetical protein